MTLQDRFKKFEQPQSTNSGIVPFEDFVIKSLFEKISTIPVWYDYSRDEQKQLIKNFLEKKINTEYKDINLTEQYKQKIIDDFLASMKGYGILDYYIAKKDVIAVIVKPSNEILLQKNNSIIENSGSVLNKELKEAITKRFDKSSPIVNECINDLFITVVSNSDCSKTIIIRKVNKISDKFSDLTKKCVLTKNIEDFLYHILEEKKNIIISGNVNTGKSAFLNVFINSINKDKRIVLLDEYSGYSSSISENMLSFGVQGYTKDEFDNLLSAAVKLEPDYIVSDMNETILSGAFYEFIPQGLKGVITTVRSSSITNAVMKYVMQTQFTQKTTEKQAKAKFASLFDYIIHIEKLSDGTYRLGSMMEITSTKSSSLVLNEILKLEDGCYVLDLPEIPSEKSQETSSKSQISFRSRLKLS